MKFQNLHKSLRAIKDFEALVVAHLEDYQMELNSSRLETLPDGSITVHVLVSDEGCDCMRYVLVRVERGPDDQLQIHPPVAARD